MLNSERRAGFAGLSVVGRLLAVSVGAGLLLAAVAVPVVGAVGVATRDAANTFNTLKVPTLGTLPSRSEILTASGKLIAYYYPNNIYRIPVSYDQIAPDMRQAIVAIEDNRYWLHGAFDLRGTVRAAVEDINGEAVQGGSTIAQEYVKNALILTAAIALPQRRDGSPWGRLWTCGTVGALAVLVLFLPAAGLESIFGYCLGCKAFALLMRAGVIPRTVCEECADISGRLRAATPAQ